MKISVLVKQVPSADSPLQINEEGTWIKEDTVMFTMNESDNYALEEALQIKEKWGDCEILVVSLGPDRVQRVIREGLAKGADRGIHIVDSFPYTFDPFETAHLFATTLKDEKCDLIFSGLQSEDLGSGQTGVILGELLGMATATLVMATELSEDTIRVKRELESGWYQWVTLPLPASITIQSGINTPRYSSLRGIVAAKKKEIRVVQKGDIENEKLLLQSLIRIYHPQKTKYTEIIEGDMDQVVEKLTDVLKKDLQLL